MSVVSVGAPTGAGEAAIGAKTIARMRAGRRWRLHQLGRRSVGTKGFGSWELELLFEDVTQRGVSGTDEQLAKVPRLFLENLSS